MVNFLKKVDICSICQKTMLQNKHWVHCPKFGEAICMTHCFNECKYMIDERCVYESRVKNEEKEKSL